MLNKVIFSLIAISSFACCSPPQNMPQWDGKFWQADHETMSVKRTQDTPPSEIKAEDPKFSEGVWLSYHDLGCLYQQLVLNCKAWKDPAPKCEPVENSIIRHELKVYNESQK